MLRHGSYPVYTDHRKYKTVFDPKQRFLSQKEPKTYDKQNLVSLNSLRCIYGGHVTGDVSGLLAQGDF